SACKAQNPGDKRDQNATSKTTAAASVDLERGLDRCRRRQSRNPDREQAAALTQYNVRRLRTEQLDDVPLVSTVHKSIRSRRSVFVEQASEAVIPNHRWLLRRARRFNPGASERRTKVQAAMWTVSIVMVKEHR